MENKQKYQITNTTNTMKIGGTLIFFLIGIVLGIAIAHVFHL